MAGMTPGGARLARCADGLPNDSKPDVRLEIRPGLPHIGAERMTGCARSFMAACTNPNAQVETGRWFRVFSGGFGLPVHITAAQTTRGVIATAIHVALSQLACCDRDTALSRNWKVIV
jgi:hypothetical protein